MDELISSAAQVFEERRGRLAARAAALGCETACVFVAGWPRPRNFAHSHFPFRAESHFLYLVGQHIEGALLVLWPSGAARLYLEPQEPEMALWEGTFPTLEEWALCLKMEVRPLAALALDEGEWSAFPPQDEATALWLSAILDEEIEAQSGPELQGHHAEWAEAMVGERLCKDEAALAQLKGIVQLSSEAHVAGMLVARSSTREAQVRAAIEAHLAGHGCSPAYTSIVTKRGEILHAARSDRSIEDGDLVLCDVGGESGEGFAADITRTWPRSGRFSDSQRQVYQAVLDVQKRAIAGAMPGVHFRELHLQAVRDMGEALIELGLLRGKVEECVALGAVSVFFPHGLGHSLGLDVHDMEDLGDRAGYDQQSRRSDDPALRFLRLSRVLKENMVVTIEPGFYQVPLLLKQARENQQLSPLINWDRLAGLSDVRGIRIEDDVVIQTAQPWVLSASAPKEVDELERLILSGSGS